jgi:hypothetical protein
MRILAQLNEPSPMSHARVRGFRVKDPRPQQLEGKSFAEILAFGE